MLTLCSNSVRNLLSFFNGIPNSQQTQITVLNDNIEWAKREKRIFLKQSLETRLISLYVHHLSLSAAAHCSLRLFVKTIGDSATQTRPRTD